MFSGNTSQVSDGRLYVEDVFSTYLYTGNGGTQTITNGIDLAGKGGMTWTKSRSTADNHHLFDSMRGSFALQSNTTLGQFAGYTYTQLSTGFSVDGQDINGFNKAFASWTFREAPKFFDVVTYTGNSTNRTIAHNLGVAPGCIIVKQTSGTSNWRVYHRGMTSAAYTIQLNQTNAESSQPSMWNSTAPTSTEFSVGTDPSVNDTGQTYVAYLFAHDATSDGVIQCGSYTGTGGASSVTVNLGWEPQFVLIKKATNSSSASFENWMIWDSMRGLNMGNDATLAANLSTAEGSTNINNGNYLNPTATGFIVDPALNGFHGVNYPSGAQFIYIAIRRGPMRTPTLGTSVFAPVARTGTGTTFVDTTNFPIDSIWFDARSQARGALSIDRLRGFSACLIPNSTGSEFSNAGYVIAMGNTGFTSGTDLYFNDTGQTYVDWNFRRAPGFFDEVCYTGTGVAPLTVNHSLGVVPELIIVKSRSLASNWPVYSAGVAAGSVLFLQSTSAASGSAPTFFGNDTTAVAPTSTVFTVGSATQVNSGNNTYVSYLFASCPGVSKVGSYTGNGSSQTINCGFAAGARFVLIKRTDSTGDWYVWDTARGIVAGNDPHLSLNTTAAEVTTDDTIDTDSSGFVVNQVAATNVNVSSATYIYLAIA